MLGFILGLAIVFAIGMLIRQALKKRQKLTAVQPPQRPQLCPKCGTPVDGTSAFCGNCGAAVN